MSWALIWRTSQDCSFRRFIDILCPRAANLTVFATALLCIVLERNAAKVLPEKRETFEYLIAILTWVWIVAAIQGLNLQWPTKSVTAILGWMPGQTGMTEGRGDERRSG